MDQIDAPISDVGVGIIANAPAPEIEGFKYRVDDIFGKVDKVRTRVTSQ